MELSKAQYIDVRAESEIPKQTELVVLPHIDYHSGISRLGIHTDTLLSLLKGLHEFGNEIPDLAVEGRLVKQESWDALENHPLYRIFTQGRALRPHTGRGLAYSLASLENSEDAIEFAEVLFTPSTLSEEVGFTTKYYSAESLVTAWLNSGTPAYILPCFNGINAFHIGSNNTKQEQLAEMKRKLVDKIEREDAEKEQVWSSPPLTDQSHFVLAAKLQEIYSIKNPQRRIAALEELEASLDGNI